MFKHGPCETRGHLVQILGIIFLDSTERSNGWCTRSTIGNSTCSPRCRRSCRVGDPEREMPSIHTAIHRAGGEIWETPAESCGSVSTEAIFRYLSSVDKLDKNEPKSGVASPNHTATMSWTVLGCIDASDSESRIMFQDFFG